MVTGTSAQSNTTSSTANNTVANANTNTSTNTSTNTNTGNNTTSTPVATSEAGRTTNTKNRTLSGSEDTADMTYKNPVIPKGFVAVDTAVATWVYTDESTVRDWNKGLVIEDGSHNEFVWVPCTLGNSDDVVTYSRKFDDYPKASIITSVSDTARTTSSAGDNVTYHAIPVEDEETQIGTYGGFYVARYEAGNPNGNNSEDNNNYNVTPVSKPNTKVWNYVDFAHSYVAAEKMISGSTYGNNKSGLITGTQWDTIMKWYENSGIGVTGSTQDWGTYKDVAYSGSGYFFTYRAYSNSYQPDPWQDGAFSHNKISTSQDINGTYPAHFHASGLNADGYKNNIADLGGNVDEFSAEEIQNGHLVLRGADARRSVSENPASYRGFTSFAEKSCLVGFRVVLYIQ